MKYCHEIFLAGLCKTTQQAKSRQHVTCKRYLPKKHKNTNHSFEYSLGAFENLRKAIIILFMSVCPSVCRSACNYSASTGWIPLSGTMAGKVLCGCLQVSKV